MPLLTKFPSVLAFLIFLTFHTSLGAPSGESRQAHSFGSFLHQKTAYGLNNNNICGISSRMPKLLKPTFNILNGNCAPYGSHPWMAQIQVRLGPEFSHHCGGTILSDDIIVTAAHCFQTVAPSQMRVVVGQGFLSSADEEEMAFDVQDAIIHPRWDSPIDGKFSNDVALIKLRRNRDGSGIQFTDRVTPACLPPHDAPQPSGSQCVISGWGKTNSEATMDTDCLMSAKVPLIPREDCQKMYDSTHRSILNGMMCAGFAEGGTDACSADSGGPMTCEVDGKHYLHGVVSWGEGCGQPNKPGVYTNVKNYLKWIQDTMQSL